MASFPPTVLEPRSLICPLQNIYQLVCCSGHPQCWMLWDELFQNLLQISGKPGITIVLASFSSNLSQMWYVGWVGAERRQHGIMKEQDLPQSQGGVSSSVRPSCTSCVTVSMFLLFPRPLFPHLYAGHNNRSYQPFSTEPMSAVGGLDRCLGASGTLKDACLPQSRHKIGEGVSFLNGSSRPCPLRETLCVSVGWCMGHPGLFFIPDHQPGIGHRFFAP